MVTGDIGGQLRPVKGRGGLAAQVNRVKERRAAAEVLVLDAGDRFFRAYHVPVAQRGPALRAAEVLARALQQTGASAMAVGERDLALGLGPLRRLAQQAQVRLLSSNLRHTASATAAFDGFWVAKTAGLKLGIVAASPVFGPQDPEGSAYAWAGLEATAPGPALRDAAAQARAAGADKILALLHMSLPQARALLADPAVHLDFAVVAHDRGAGGASTTLGLARLRDRNQTQVELQYMSASGRFLAETATITAQMGRDEATQRAVDLAVSAPEPPAGDAYVGATACAKACHAPALQWWKKTGHATAFARLRAEKQTGNLDCVACHTTGFARPGGPTRLSGLEGLREVGCEACHGPAPAHARAPDTERVGPVAARVCEQCHGPQAEQAEFKLEARWPRVSGPGHGAPAAAPEP